MKIKINYDPHTGCFGKSLRYQACHYKQNGWLSGIYGYGKTEEKAIEDLLKKISKNKISEYPKIIEID